MKSNSLHLNNISFSYDSFSKPIFQSLSLNIHHGWTGIIGANGTGKTTFLKLCINELKVQEGNIISPQFSMYCEQRTDNFPDDINNFIYSSDKFAIKMRALLDIEESFITRWNTLSHGERKRIQIGNALYQEPDLLVIDEPTNHLDEDAKNIIKKALNEYKGIGLIVSHDRDLLDLLCTHCIFIDPPGVILFKGNYTEAKKNYDSDIQYNKKMQVKLQKEKQRINSIIKNRKIIALDSDKRMSKKGIAKKDHDSKAKINSAKLTGKDAVGGKLVNQIQGRLNQVSEKLNKYKIKKEYRTGIEFRIEVSKRKNIFFIEQDQIDLGTRKQLIIKNLTINPSDKIGLTGKNGSGKSTLVNYILKNNNLNPRNILYIPQEIDIRETSLIRNNIKKLNDNELGSLLSLVTRLGTEPKRILESELYSPGETRKLLFAFGILNNPAFIIMDEPTNHLDIVAIECLEHALKDLDCTILLVSHDRVFLKNLVTINWYIEELDNNFILKEV